jgi:methyltransferase
MPLPALPLVPTFAIIYSLLATERMLELVINRRNTRALTARGAVWMPDDGFASILAAQALLFVLLPLEIAMSPWTATGWWTWVLLGVAVLAQGLRYWCIATLGERWNIRVVTLPGASRIRGGPYRVLRHPNYLAVATEALALPLAFGALGTALVVFPFQLLALRSRIAKEERALTGATARA